VISRQEKKALKAKQNLFFMNFIATQISIFLASFTGGEESDKNLWQN
jgi:hypothetical protein